MLTEDENNVYSSDSDTESSYTNNDDNRRHNKKLELKDAVSTVDERALYTTIDSFLKKECTQEQLERMIKIIAKEDKISLRLLNWFSMKHSAAMEGLEVQGANGKIEIFHVKISYKARLKAHSKKYFDPFRRGKRFDYYYAQDKCIETTLCQLNFFKWLFTYKLIDYVNNNYEMLVKKMAIYEKKKKAQKIKKKEKKINQKEKKDPPKASIKKFSDDVNTKLILVL